MEREEDKCCWGWLVASGGDGASDQAVTGLAREACWGDPSLGNEDIKTLFILSKKLVVILIQLSVEI